MTGITLNSEIKADLIEALSIENATTGQRIAITAICRLINLSQDSEELRLALYQAANACVEAIGIMDAVLKIETKNNITLDNRKVG